MPCLSLRSPFSPVLEIHAIWGHINVMLVLLEEGVSQVLPLANVGSI